MANGSDARLGSAHDRCLNLFRHTAIIRERVLPQRGSVEERSKTRILVVPAALAALLVLAGCGDEEASDRAAAGSTTNESRQQASIPPPTLVAPTTATTTESVGPRVYVHRYLTTPPEQPYGPLRVRPSTLNVPGTGAIYFQRLRWSDWGEASATATGQQCSGRAQSCEEGAVTLTLSGRKRQSGRLVYMRYSVSDPVVGGAVRHCGDVKSSHVFDISARGVSCVRARRIAVTAIPVINSTDDGGDVEGYACRPIGREGVEATIARCTRGKQAVRFTFGS